MHTDTAKENTQVKSGKSIIINTGLAWDWHLKTALFSFTSYLIRFNWK